VELDHWWINPRVPCKAEGPHLALKKKHVQKTQILFKAHISLGNGR